MTYRAFGSEGRLPYRKYADYAAVTMSGIQTLKHVPLISPAYASARSAGQTSDSAVLPVTKKIKNMEVEILPAMSSGDYFNGFVAFTRWVSTSSPPTGYMANTHDGGKVEQSRLLFWDRRVLRPQPVSRNFNWQAPLLVSLPAIDVSPTDYLYLTFWPLYSTSAPTFQCVWKWAELEIPT